jgi:hypothetical protein
MSGFYEAHGINPHHENGISLSREPNGLDRLVVTYDALEDCFRLRAEGNDPAGRKRDLDDKCFQALEENLDVVNRAADAALQAKSTTKEGLPLVTSVILADALNSRRS